MRPSGGIAYVLDLSRRGHELGVTASIADPATDDGRLTLYLPRWAPGSYLVREFARHVDRIAAHQGGRGLPVGKSGVDEWTIEGVADGQPLEVRYDLYARELTVRTNYVADDRALVAGA